MKPEDAAAEATDSPKRLRRMNCKQPLETPSPEVPRKHPESPVPSAMQMVPYEPKPKTSADKPRAKCAAKAAAKKRDAAKATKQGTMKRPSKKTSTEQDLKGVKLDISYEDLQKKLRSVASSTLFLPSLASLPCPHLRFETRRGIRLDDKG